MPQYPKVMETEWADVADVAGIPVADMIASSDTVLANSIRRLVADVASTDEPISAWSSFIDQPPKEES